MTYGLIIGIPPTVTSLASKRSFDCYLSPTGNDSADGSISAPWLTLARVQAEFDKNTYGALSMVRLYIAAGTYTAVDLDGSAFARGGRFVIQALSTTTLLSGTVIAGSTVSVMNTSALGGTNNYARKWVRRRNSGGTILDERQIGQNTATSITPTVSWLSVPALTDVFEIFEPAVVIDGTARTYAFSNFPGMCNYQSRLLITGADPMGAGGGVYLADVRWWSGLAASATPIYLRNTFLYSKALELFGASLTNVTVRLDYQSAWACGIHVVSSVPATTQFLSTFMNLTNDDMWAGCGIGTSMAAAGGTLRIEGGNWWGYACAQSLLFNASPSDTPWPTALLCGGALDCPAGVGNALGIGYGFLLTRYPQLAPNNPMPVSCAGNFPTIAIGGGFSPLACTLGYLNIVNTYAPGQVCLRSDSGGVVTLSPSCIGNSSNGFGIEARNGGVIQLSGALNITGLSGDSRVDGANIQAKAFYSAANIANPATPGGSGSRIYRSS